MPTVSRKQLEAMPGFDPAFHLGEKPLPVPPPAPECSEKEFQARVIAYAQERGWRCWHCYNSRRSAPGFLDLFMVRFERLILAELKTETGKESKAQREWRADLEKVGGHVSAYLWRPSDWERILEILK